MERTQSRWWDGLVCACLVVLAVLVSFPFAEMGFGDDFSYVKMAYDYAQTGHLIYNGWGAPMLGWQAVWGSWFIKLFGFSFSVVRLSMLPIALATVWLFFVSLIRFRVTRRNAYFGTLLFGFSPLFIPLAASFMTDLPSAFVILLCTYLCQRAVAAKTDRATISWLAAAAGTNMVGGTARQIAWLGILVMVPSTAWLLRKRRGVLIAGFVFWCLGAAFVFACVHWLNRQPYSVPERLLFTSPFVPTLILVLGCLTKLYLCLSLLVFPLLTVWLRCFRQLPRADQILIVAFASIIQLYSLHSGWILPWLTNVINNLGVHNFEWALGLPPGPLNWMLRFIGGSVIVFVSMAFLLYFVRTKILPRRTSMAPSLRAFTKGGIDVPWNPELWILVPFTVCYLALLIPRTVISAHLYDRYLIALLPVAIIYLLKLYQETFSRLIPISSYIFLVLFSLFGIAGTHDWFALNRARLKAASVLLDSGIPDTKMQLGLDYDGWIQLKYSPVIYEPRFPATGVVYKPVRPPSLAAQCALSSAGMTPSIIPEYFVVLDPMPCLAQSHFAPIRYRAWLPPFHRTIYIEQRP